MAVQETKTVKTYTKYKVTCDVCGVEIKDKLSYWWMTEYCNGEVVGEYKAPIDLCSVHQRFYSEFIYTTAYPFKYIKERYNNVPDDVKQEIIEKIKEIEVEHNDY